MYCVHCGKNVEENSNFCNNCGKRLNNIETDFSNSEVSNSINYETSTNPIETNENAFNYNDEVITKTEDKANIWLVLLAIFIPIVGLILFIVYFSKTPKKAKAIGIAALLSFVIRIVFSALIVFFSVATVFPSISDYYDDYYYDDYYDEFYEEFDFENYDFEYDNNLKDYDSQNTI